MRDWIYEISELAMSLNLENREEAFRYINELIIKQEADEPCHSDAVQAESDVAAESQNVQGHEDEALRTCPHCGGKASRFGIKRGKQRYICKSCGKTYVETTNTIRLYSQQDKATWDTVAEDTANFLPLRVTAEKLGLSTQTIFRMRHKILFGLDRQEDKNPTVLGNTSEIDETYVPDSYKGSPLPADFYRGPRKNGKKALKRGLSNEQVCICTIVERGGKQFAITVNRSRPSNEEAIKAYAPHLMPGTIVVCDGLNSYPAVGEASNTVIVSINKKEDKEQGYRNSQAVSGFHSLIKHVYAGYRGVATKYLNRYNALWARAYGKNANVLECIHQLFEPELGDSPFMPIEKLSSTMVLAL